MGCGRVLFVPRAPLLINEPANARKNSSSGIPHSYRQGDACAGPRYKPPIARDRQRAKTGSVLETTLRDVS